MYSSQDNPVVSDLYHTGTGSVAPENVVADVTAKLLALGGEGDGGLEALFPGHEPSWVAGDADDIAAITDEPDGDDGSAIFTLSDDESDG